MDGVRLAPQAEKRPVAGGERSAAARQPLGETIDARPRPVAGDRPAVRDEGVESAHAPCQPKQRGDVLEPGDQRRRQVDAGGEHQAEMDEHRHVGGLDRRGAAGRLAEGEAAQAAGTARRRRPACRRRAGWRAAAARAKVELTTRNSLMKMPSGGRPAMATTPSTRPQPSSGMADGQAADVGDLLRALDLRDMADGEEDRRTW